MQRMTVSTRRNYLSKWKRFSIWVAQCSVDPVQAWVLKILEYLLPLKYSSLSSSTFMVFLDAITLARRE